MPFEKGHKLSGSRKGIKNQKTTQWEKFGEFMMNTGLERFEEEMKKLNGKDYVVTVKDMMEYFQPKLARTEVTGKDGEALFPKPIMDICPKDNTNDQKNS